MNGNGQHRPAPSPSHKEMKKTVGKHEFTAGFYPGFASSIKVNGESWNTEEGTVDFDEFLDKASLAILNHNAAG